ncbi:MAG: DUF4430 domain-containing protein [Ruminococcus sp.]|nr:DUF4430 domain-containing protein [Ruminococcus sp.]
MSDKTVKIIKALAAAVVIAAVLIFAYRSGSSVAPADTGSTAETSQTSAVTASSSLSSQTVTEAAADTSSAPDRDVTSRTETTSTAQQTTAVSKPAETTSRKPEQSSAPETTSASTAAAPTAGTSASTAAPAVPESSTAAAATTTAAKATTTTAATTTTTTTTEKQETEDKYPYHCTLIIECRTIFNDPDKIDKAIAAEQPQDGIIFPQSEVGFNEGDTVYDAVSRICSENGIPMEVTKIAGTNNYYIEGINNLYEFDAGNLSGWMYSQNGKFPQLSCSQAELHDGDEIRMVYSCNIGVDVGDDYFAKAG